MTHAEILEQLLARQAQLRIALILLAEVPLAYPCGAVAANKLTLDTPVEGMILASGNATWARIRSRNGDVVADCDIGEVNSAGQVVAAGDLLLNSLTLFAGGTLRLVSGHLG